MDEQCAPQHADPTVHETGSPVPPFPKEEHSLTLVTVHKPLLENNRSERNIDVRSESPRSLRPLSVQNDSFSHSKQNHRIKLPLLSPSRNHRTHEMEELSIDRSDLDVTQQKGTNSAMSALPSPSYQVASISSIQPILASPRSNLALTPSLSPRGTENKEISHHALERLGVDMNIVKKGKGMKKLGISDVDIEQSAQIQRYSGVPLQGAGITTTKAELIFGFTNEQLVREKAMIVLGTSEEEVYDEYCRRLSSLGAHESLPILQRTQ